MDVPAREEASCGGLGSAYQVDELRIGEALSERAEEPHEAVVDLDVVLGVGEALLTVRGGPQLMAGCEVRGVRSGPGEGD